MTKRDTKQNRSESGQAVVEFALVVPIFAILLAAMMFSAQFFLAKLFLMQVVREGYFTMVYADLSKNQTEQFLQARFYEKAMTYFSQSTFHVRVEKHEGLLNLRPSLVKAEGQLPLSRLSQEVLGPNPITVRAQLVGYAGTGRGGKSLMRATSKISELFRKAGLPSGG